MEGKEQRLSVAEAAPFSVGTTMTSTGAVNSCTTRTPPSAAWRLSGILLGEVAPGGVGSGLYGMLLFAVADGVHRRPDDRPDAGVPRQDDPGARGEAVDHRRADHAGRPAITLGIAVVVQAGVIGPLNGGPHGFSEIFYGLASQWNNNGSRSAG